MGDTVRTAVFFSGLAFCLFMFWAISFHFKSKRPSFAFVLLSFASAINIFVFARHIWRTGTGQENGAVALACFAMAAALFIWAIEASKAARLKLIFDPNTPQAILKSGPYRYVRHPFYACYIVFWSGCAIATLNPINIAFAVCLVPLLVMMARREESTFAASAVAAEYQHYRQTAGLFWPKLLTRA